MPFPAYFENSVDRETKNRGVEDEHAYPDHNKIWSHGDQLNFDLSKLAVPTVPPEHRVVKR